MIEAIFKNKPAFIPYLMAGDPDLETTAALIGALAASGASAIELGVPYGDPLADGPTIAAAGVRALSIGVGLKETVELVRQVHGTSPPLILFTYFNPIYQYGVESFARDAALAGISGVIVPDVPLEESSELRGMLLAHGLQMPLLVAPSTPLERAKRIAQQSSGFLYVVSRLGVTGAGSTPDFAPLRKQVAALRGLTDKPLAIGFGISNRAHVDAVRDVADGFIVGSAIIDSYAGTRGAQAAEKVRVFANSLR